MNITLIGMPGSGKSSVGRVLAHRLHMDFLDVDPLIVQRYQAPSLQSVLELLGNDAFLDAEADVISTLNCKNTVIAPGGSAILREAGINHLKQLGTVVYLKLPYSVVEKRLWNLTSRGITLSPGETLYDLYALRTPLYERFADVVVDADQPHVEDTVEKVLEGLKL